MPSATTPAQAKSISNDRIVDQVLAAVVEIDRQAREKKLAELETLRSAKTAILNRIEELQHQLEQIASVEDAVGESRTMSEKGEARRNWTEDRERVRRFLEARPGQKLAANDLVRQFPELGRQPVSTLLKPLVDAGTLKKDISRGRRRTKYFVEA